MSQAEDRARGGLRDRGPRWFRRLHLRPLPLVLSVAVGLLLGSSLFVVNYAEGVSYLSNDPMKCTN